MRQTIGVRILGTGRFARKTDSAQARFERAVWPHLDAAYNLACYLTRNDQDAEDVVQEAVVRAFAAFDRHYGNDTRAWFLTIVRNAGYTFLRRRSAHMTVVFEEELHDTADDSGSPESVLLNSVSREILLRALDTLPVEFREVLVLRDQEGLSYREIATIADVPMGTVMSRLARARRRMQSILTACQSEENERGL